jgi:mRNA interferase MazF
MRRGDIVTVAVSGDYGKPRPAVIVQSDALPEGHASVIICQMTSKRIVGSAFRIDVEARDANGLRADSQIMVDKPATVRSDRIGSLIGKLSLPEVARLNSALAFVLGLSD